MFCRFEFGQGGEAVDVRDQVGLLELRMGGPGARAQRAEGATLVNMTA